MQRESAASAAFRVSGVFLREEVKDAPKTSYEVLHNSTYSDYFTPVKPHGIFRALVGGYNL